MKTTKTLIIVPDGKFSSDAILSLPPDSGSRLIQTGPKEEELPGFEVSPNQHAYLMKTSKSIPELRFRTFIQPEGEKYVYEQGKRPAKRTVRRRKATKRIVSGLRKAISKVENR